MRQIIIIAVMTLLLTISAFAEESGDAATTEGQQICDYAMEQAGIRVGDVFDSKMPYKNERFNGYTHSGDTIGHIIIQDRAVISIGCDLIDDPTFNVYVKDLATVVDVREAENMIDAFNSKLSSKDVEIKGETFTKSVKGFFTKVGIRVASWFS